MLVLCVVCCLVYCDVCVWCGVLMLIGVVVFMVVRVVMVCSVLFGYVLCGVFCSGLL